MTCLENAGIHVHDGEALSAKRRVVPQVRIDPKILLEKPSRLENAQKLGHAMGIALACGGACAGLAGSYLVMAALVVVAGKIFEASGEIRQDMEIQEKARTEILKKDLLLDAVVHPHHLRRLLEKGYNPSGIAGQETPLHKAVKLEGQGYPLARKSMGILLAHGADVNARDEQGNTPAMVAALNWDLGTLEYLARCPELDRKIGNNRGETLRDLLCPPMPKKPVSRRFEPKQ